MRVGARHPRLVSSQRALLDPSPQTRDDHPTRSKAGCPCTLAGYTFAFRWHHQLTPMKGPIARGSTVSNKIMRPVERAAVTMGRRGAAAYGLRDVSRQLVSNREEGT